MNKISDAFGRIGTQSGMIFFTILIIGFSFGGGVVPSAVQAYEYDGCCDDYGSYSYSPSDYGDYSYAPADYGDYSYSPFDYGDYSYSPSDYGDYSYAPADYGDYSYSPFDYGDYSYSQMPPLYVDGECYSGCGGQPQLPNEGCYGCGGGRSYSPPPSRTPPPPTGCGYSSGGCGSRTSTPSYFNSSNTNINTNTNINNTNISNVNTNTNSYFNVQTQNPFVPQPVCTVYASPNSVQYGGGTTLTWNTSNATSAYLSGYGNVNANGSQWISNITGSQTYTLTVNGQGGSNSCSATVSVSVPAVPTCTLTYAQAGGYNYNYGTNYNNTTGTLLSWSSTNASSAYITNIGTVSTNGSQTVYPTSNTTYQMTVYGVNGGSNICSVNIPVTPVQNNLYCTITANPASIQNGASSVLNWTSYGASSATLSDGLGNAAVNGSLTVRPESSRVYTLTVRDYQGRTNTCYTTVTVSGSQVSLTSIPYTGFDGGITTNALYWMGLALWALIAGWFVVRYRGSVANFFDGSGMRPAFAAAEPTIIRERVIEKSRPVAEAPVQATQTSIASVRTDSTDTMVLHSKEGETPRLVIKRG